MIYIYIFFFFLIKALQHCYVLQCIINHHHHHHVALSARIFLTVSRHTSLSSIDFGRSSALHPDRHRAAACRFELDFLPLLVHVQGSTGVNHPSLLLQQCPACLVCLILIVFVMGGRWLYSFCFVGCCFQDLFNIARSILV